jgi:hypothetical protein
MPFIDVKLADVELEKPAGLTAGKYVFQLLPGAEVRNNKFTNNEELNVSAAVAEGDSAGRRIFLTYPDPTSVSKNGKPMAWSAQALKKLEISLGVDSLPGENAAEYLNRVALSGNGRFTITLGLDGYIKEGETEARIVPKLFTVGPAA